MPTRNKDSVRFRQIDIVSDDIKLLQDQVKSLKEEIKKINELLQVKEGTKNSSSWWG
tara:strand:- start:1751 stop:1921 length:171 start_codon:yes stop_codon:yes gene_type:complete